MVLERFSVRVLGLRMSESTLRLGGKLGVLLYRELPLTRLILFHSLRLQ